MSRRTVVWILFAAWLALFAAGFLVYVVAEPTGDGFHRGINRVGNFLGLETAAALAAVASWIIMRRCRYGDRGILIAGYTPPIVSGLLWGVLIGFVLFAIVTAQLAA